MARRREDLIVAQARAHDQQEQLKTAISKQVDSELAAAEIVAADRLPELLLFNGAPIAEEIAGRRLSSFASLTPKARTRLEQTALAYVQERGNAAAMARALHVHPQTARYRLARLRELLGDDLGSPERRFELEIALRARGVSLP